MLIGDMTSTRLALLLLLLGITGHQAAAQGGGPQLPSLPLGVGRPEIIGIARTPIRDDAKAAVARVRFDPNAAEPPHTHPNDVIIVAVTGGPVDFRIGDARITTLAPGEVHFVPRDVVHHMKNTGLQTFELVAISLK